MIEQLANFTTLAVSFTSGFLLCSLFNNFFSPVFEALNRVHKINQLGVQNAILKIENEELKRTSDILKEQNTLYYLREGEMQNEIASLKERI